MRHIYGHSENLIVTPRIYITFYEDAKIGYHIQAGPSPEQKFCSLLIWASPAIKLAIPSRKYWKLYEAAHIVANTLYCLGSIANVTSWLYNVEIVGTAYLFIYLFVRL
jgi:hypothetical protein